MSHNVKTMNYILIHKIIFKCFLMENYVLGDENLIKNGAYLRVRYNDIVHLSMETGQTRVEVLMSSGHTCVNLDKLGKTVKPLIEALYLQL